MKLVMRALAAHSSRKTVSLIHSHTLTNAQVIAHWRKGAGDALRLARLAAKDTLYELALFHCHLALEKALKAAIMAKTGKPHPKIHALTRLASLLSEQWSTEEKELLDTLSDFAVAARYDDPVWAKRFATAKNAKLWLKRTRAFLAAHALL